MIPIKDINLENNILEDEFGPERMVILNDISLNMKAFVVVDNSIYGVPAGGCRMAPDITLNEISRLARTMTLKFCTYRVPLGGAKSGICSDPLTKNKDLIITSFANLIKPYLKEKIYYYGADMGTTALDQERIFKIAGITNIAFPNIEFKRKGFFIEDHFTGYGVVFSLETILKKVKWMKDTIQKPSILLEGFGKVAKSVMLRIKESRFNLKGLSTIKGAVYDDDGLNIDKLLNLRETYGDDAINFYESKNLIKIEKEKLFELSSEYQIDFIIPGARPDVINKKNINKIKPKGIVSAANIPYAEGVIEILEENGILAFPDFVSNGGAVIIESMMFNQWTVDELFNYLQKVITIKTSEILHGANEKKVNSYEYAKFKALEELRKKKLKRRKKIENLNKRY